MSLKPEKTLIDQIKPRLAFVIVFNALVFYLFVFYQNVGLEAFKPLAGEIMEFLSLTGFSYILAVVLNGLIAQRTKNQLVFLRIKDALPSHRAFSKYVKGSPLINEENLRKWVGGTFPQTPEAQNRLWFEVLYQPVQNDPVVLSLHKSFLLTQHYTSLSLLFFFGFGAMALIFQWGLQGWVYIIFLTLQFLLTRVAAANYGKSMVKRVLSICSTQEGVFEI